MGAAFLLVIGAALLPQLANAYPAADSEVAPAVVPCPGIMASSPQTLSTTPPPVPLNPCPGIVMSTYFGGSSHDVAKDVAVDVSGNIYITGYTNSTDFPTTPDAYDPTFNGVPEEYIPGQDIWISIYDVFLAKFTPTGNLVFSTFFGGTSVDTASSIALDASGSVYITGTTRSTDFPTTKDAFDTTFGPRADAFIAKFDPNGALLYSTFLGGKAVVDGTGEEFGQAIAVDVLGSAYVTGMTSSPDFPIKADVVHRGTSFDVYVAKLNPWGTALEYSAVIGGMGLEWSYSIAVDAQGSAYVAGRTDALDFPVTPGALDPSIEEDGGVDGYVFKLNPEASALEYSTFLGGSFGDDAAFAVVVDNAGNAYVTGWTNSPDFPTTPGAFDTTISDAQSPQCCDAFVAKLDASGSALLYSTFLGGAKPAGGGYVGVDQGNGIFVDEFGQAYVVGTTDSVDFPTSPGAYDATYNGESWYNQDAFVTKLDPEGSTLAYSTFLGGGDDVLFIETQPERDRCSQDCGDLGYSLVLDSTGNATVVGTTNALDFPVTEGADDPTFNGGRFDIFIVRMELIPEPNRVPVAYFEVTSSPEDPGHVSADATNSSDAEDPLDLLEIRWDWEDDGVWDTAWSTVKVASHDYSRDETYTIRLEVRDTDGLTGEMTREIPVTGIPPVNHEPSLTITEISPSSTIAGHEVTLTAVVSDLDRDSLSWTIAWGDGATSTGSTPAGGGPITATHSYGIPGTYTITFTVTDAEGGSTSETASVNVSAPPPPPSSGLQPAVLWALGGVVVAAAAGAGYLAWRRMRTSPK